MARAFIGFGSNIDPERNVREALRLLTRQVDVLAISTFYRTRALACPDQPDYLNGVAMIETVLPPVDLKFRILRGIEQQLGRTREQDKYAARTIDLDLLLYGDEVVVTEGLVLPHPDVVSRAFLAKPLCELAPTLVLPGSRESIGSIAARLSAADMEPLPEFTRELREVLAGAEHAFQDHGR